MADGDNHSEPSPTSDLSQMVGLSRLHALLFTDGSLTVTLTATPSAFGKRLYKLYCKTLMERTINTCPSLTVMPSHRHSDKLLTSTLVD